MTSVTAVDGTKLYVEWTPAADSIQVSMGAIPWVGGGGVLGVKNSRGAPLEVQNGTQNKIWIKW